MQPKGLGLIRGTAGHEALASWYKEQDQVKATEVAIEAWEGDKDSKDLKELLQTLARYFEYSLKNDYSFEVIETEQKFLLDIGEGQQLTGFIDGVVKYQDQIWLLEHKFNKRVETRHLDLDMQVSIYLLAAQLLGYDPAGVMYNVVRVGTKGKALTEPVVRSFVYRNKEGLRAVNGELIFQMQEVERYLEEGGAVYRNTTRDCSWDCGFHKVCLSINDTGEAQSILDTYERKEYKRGK
jgi:hypothetical protein